MRLGVGAFWLLNASNTLDPRPRPDPVLLWLRFELCSGVLERDKCWLFELGAVVMLLGGTAPKPAAAETDADASTEVEAEAAAVDDDVGSNGCRVAVAVAEGVGVGVLAAWLPLWPGSSNNEKLSSSDAPEANGIAFGTGGGGDNEGRGVVVVLGMLWSCGCWVRHVVSYR